MHLNGQFEYMIKIFTIFQTYRRILSVASGKFPHSYEISAVSVHVSTRFLMSGLLGSVHVREIVLEPGFLASDLTS